MIDAYDVQSVLARTDPEEVSRFVALARPGWDATDRALLDAIVELGLTPWQAARHVVDTGQTGLSQSSAYARARRIEEEIQAHFGRSPEDWIELLRRSGRVTGIPQGYLGDIERLARREGWSISITLSVQKEDVV